MEKKDLLNFLYDAKNIEYDKQCAESKYYIERKNNVLDISGKIKSTNSELEKLKNSEFRDEITDKTNYEINDFKNTRILKIIMYIIILIITILISYTNIIKPITNKEYEYRSQAGNFQDWSINLNKELASRANFQFLIFIVIISIIETIIIQIAYKKSKDDTDFYPSFIKKLLITDLITGVISYVILSSTNGNFVKTGEYVKITLLGYAIPIVTTILTIALIDIFKIVYLKIYNKTIAKRKYEDEYNKYLTEKPVKEKEFKDNKDKRIKKYEEKIKGYEEELKEANKMCEDAEKKVKELEQKFNDICNKNGLHVDYQNIICITNFIDYLEKGRADNLKECINLFESEMKQKRMEGEINKAKDIAQNAISQANEAANIATSANEIAYNAASMANDASKKADDAVETSVNAADRANKAIDKVNYKY